jgi:hypothetical protein
VKIAIAAEPLPESQLVLVSVPAELDDTYRERLERAVSEVHAAVAALECALAAAALPVMARAAA